MMRGNFYLQTQFWNTGPAWQGEDTYNDGDDDNSAREKIPAKPSPQTIHLLSHSRTRRRKMPSMRGSTAPRNRPQRRPKGNMGHPEPTPTLQTMQCQPTEPSGD